MKPPVDPKRSGVRASLIAWSEPPMELIDHRWHGPPGAFLDRAGMNVNQWLLCCPGCCEAGSPRDGATWQAVAGGFDDVTTLTLLPSILRNCCGWHGYLVRGVFQMDPPSVTGQ